MLKLDYQNCNFSQQCVLYVYILYITDETEIHTYPSFDQDGGAK